MWHQKTVSLIFPTFREKKSIREVILDFDSTGLIDEILVVNNNAEVGTNIEVGKTRAQLVTETEQGYGAAIQAGIKASKADILIISEPDGTYDGNDVKKLLAYSDDFDMVFGTRTHVPLIHSGSEMHFARRIFDVFLGKLICLLFLTSTLTDVGCTLRLTNRKGWKKIYKECKAKDAMFATEWLLLAVKNKVRFIEIPVNFQPRIGESSLTKTFFQQAKWGILIFLYIWKVWIYGLLNRKLY